MAYDASVKGLAANGFGEHSPGQYSMAGGFVGEVVLTFIFLSVILGATAKNADVARALDTVWSAEGRETLYLK